MKSRRQVLSGLGTATVISTSGCLGLLSDDDEEEQEFEVGVTRRNVTIQEGRISPTTCADELETEFEFNVLNQDLLEFEAIITAPSRCYSPVFTEISGEDGGNVQVVIGVEETPDVRTCDDCAGALFIEGEILFEEPPTEVIVELQGEETVEEVALTS